MAGPWGALADRIAAAFGEGPLPNIRLSLSAQVEPDSIIIRPGDPWLDHVDKPRFTAHLERYVAICAVRVGDPESATEALYEMTQAVTEAASDEGWDWVNVSTITLDETTGVPLLVASVNVTYNGG